MRTRRVLAWIDKHPYLAAGAGGAFVVITGVIFGAKAGASVSPPSSGGRTRLLGDTLTAKPGHIYFATIVTHGIANAATAAQVVAKAKSMGFTNVQPSQAPPRGWPSPLSGDWYVVATFAGAAPVQVQRNNGSFAAGADVVDVWESQ
jgi:hypothetical protein